MEDHSGQTWQADLKHEIGTDRTLTNLLDLASRKKNDVHLARGDHRIDGLFQVCRGTNINGRLRNRGRTLMGRYCAFSENLTVVSTNHRTDTLNMNIQLQIRLGFRNNHIGGKVSVIGHNVWGGNGVMILNGITIGTGAVLAAGAVTTKDVPPFEIHGGVSAKRIGSRFHPAVVQQMLEIAWWHWPEEKMLRNEKLSGIRIRPDRNMDLMRFVAE